MRSRNSSRGPSELLGEEHQYESGRFLMSSQHPSVGENNLLHMSLRMSVEQKLNALNLCGVKWLGTFLLSRHDERP